MIHRKINLIFGTLILIGLISACQETASNSSEESIVGLENETEPRVQAVLLTQAHPYDNENKTQIEGDYVAQKSLDVPSDLSPQNKWVMFEGPVLENDLIAYRFYMDSRHRSDIYGKRVNDLVMDTVSWQYHDIMDWGSDILKVNASLGIGSPAIWYNDSLYTLSNHGQKTVAITEQTDKKATVRFTFNDLKIGNHSFNIIQDWSIEAGQAWTTTDLKAEGGLPEDMYFATGIVKHLEEIEENTVAGQQYAFTWGKQSFHKENMGMGLVMDQKYEPEKTDNIWSHVYVFKNAKEAVQYKFLAAWERDVIGVKDTDGFRTLIEQACEPIQ